MRTASLWAALGLSSMLVLAPAAAQAASEIPNADPNGDFCASHISTDTPMSDPVCFATAEDLQAYFAQIGVEDPSPTVLRANAAAQVVLGTVYKNAHLKGTSLTFYGSGSACNGVTYGFSSLASGWNNSISSAIASTGCWMTMYDQTSYGGSRINCTPLCDTISTFNDKIKSIVFRPAGQFG